MLAPWRTWQILHDFAATLPGWWKMKEEWTFVPVISEIIVKLLKLLKSKSQGNDARGCWIHEGIDQFMQSLISNNNILGNYPHCPARSRWDGKDTLLSTKCVVWQTQLLRFAEGISLKVVMHGSVNRVDMGWLLGGFWVWQSQVLIFVALLSSGLLALAAGQVSKSTSCGLCRVFMWFGFLGSLRRAFHVIGWSIPFHNFTLSTLK